MAFWSVERQPEAIRWVRPEYPEVARRSGMSGVVFVEFRVGADGRVSDARVIRGPEIFREAALAAVRQSVFRPAIQNDKPVAVRMTLPVRFELNR